MCCLLSVHQDFLLVFPMVAEVLAGALVHMISSLQSIVRLFALAPDLNRCILAEWEKHVTEEEC